MRRGNNYSIKGLHLIAWLIGRWDFECDVHMVLNEFGFF